MTYNEDLPMINIQTLVDNAISANLEDYKS